MSGLCLGQAREYSTFGLARNARAYIFSRRIGFCAIWVCISSSLSSSSSVEGRRRGGGANEKIAVLTTLASCSSDYQCMQHSYGHTEASTKGK